MDEILALLPADAQERARQQAQQAALLQLGFGLLGASRGQPGQGRPSVAQAIGQVGPQALQAYQGSIDQTLQAMLVRQKMEEAQRRKEQEARQQAALQSFVSTLPEDQRARFAAFPQHAAEAMFRPVKQSIQTIYSPEGKETKVLFNESTGEYAPIGGAKAESFVQVDRGNIIELRRPSGEVIGSIPKGVAPTAPSYTMTDAGVLNTRTGQLVQPKDEKGNPIVLDQTARATEGERLSSGFYMRMADASNTFMKPLTDAQNKPIVKNGKSITLEDVASKPEILPEIVGSILPNWMGGQAAQQALTSPLREQYEQAQENWVTANLRKESGAVISPEEMKKEIRKWFPVVGNSQEVIEQKRKARKVAEESMRRNAGRALSVIPSQTQNITVDY